MIKKNGKKFMNLIKKIIIFFIYYKINRELISPFRPNNNKNTAWTHWLMHGKKEERAFSFINK